MTHTQSRLTEDGRIVLKFADWINEPLPKWNRARGARKAPVVFE